jgi:flagellar basal-body rod protein FlgC
MDFIKSIAIAASGMRAQAGRMRILAENIANADSTASAPGADPYRRRIVTFHSELDRELDAHVVRLGRSPPMHRISVSATSRTIRWPTPRAKSNIRT